MVYLIFNTEQFAITRSGEIATNQGCIGNITQYWFGWVTSYANPPLTALIIPEDQINLLTPIRLIEKRFKSLLDV